MLKRNSMNWFTKKFIYKFAAAASKIQRYHIANPSVKFFINQYEDAIPWNEVEKNMSNGEDPEKFIQNYISSKLLPSLGEKIDPNNKNNYFMKREDILDDTVIDELRMTDEARGVRPPSSYSDSIMQRARELILKDINDEKSTQFNRWWSYINEEEIYSQDPAFQFSILKPMIESSPSTKKNGPPPVNGEIIAGIWQDIHEKGVDQMNILKKYKKLAVAEEKKRSESEGAIETSQGGRWIRIKGKQNSANDQEFRKNVDRLKSLSQSTGWCTGRGMAEPYLSKGDFYLYLIGDNAVVAIRLDGNRVAEIRGKFNDQKQLNPYWQEVINFLADKPFDYKGCSQYKTLFEIYLMNAKLERGSEEYNAVLNNIKKDHSIYLQLSEENKKKFPEFLDAAKLGFEKDINKFLYALEGIGPGEDKKGQYLHAFEEFQDHYNRLPQEIKNAMGDIRPRIIQAHKVAFRNNPYLFPDFPPDIQSTFSPREQKEAWISYVQDDPYRLNNPSIPREVRAELAPNTKAMWANKLKYTANHLDYMPKEALELFTPQELEGYVLNDFAKFPVARMGGELYKLKRVEDLANKGVVSRDKIVNILKQFSMSYPDLTYLIPQEYQNSMFQGQQAHQVGYLLESELGKLMDNPESFSMLNIDTQKALLQNKKYRDQVVQAFLNQKANYRGMLAEWWEKIPPSIRRYMPLPDTIEVAKYYALLLMRNPQEQIPNDISLMVRNELKKMNRTSATIRFNMVKSSSRKNRLIKTSKKKDTGFDYSDLIRGFWDKLLYDERDRLKISFNTENDSPVDDPRYIAIEKEQKSGDHIRKYRLYAQLMCAGGDWENPIYYFRCQVDTKTYFDNQDEWSDTWSKGEYLLIHIPSMKDGNKNLRKLDEKKWEYGLTDNSEDDGYDFKSKDIKKLWEDLEKKVPQRVTEFFEESCDYDIDKDELLKKYNVYSHFDLSKLLK